MSGINPVFLVRKAKKSSGQKDAVLGAVMILKRQMQHWIIF